MSVSRRKRLLNPKGFPVGRGQGRGVCNSFRIAITGVVSTQRGVGKVLNTTNAIITTITTTRRWRSRTTAR